VSVSLSLTLPLLYLTPSTSSMNFSLRPICPLTTSPTLSQLSHLLNGCSLTHTHPVPGSAGVSRSTAQHQQGEQLLSSCIHSTLTYFSSVLYVFTGCTFYLNDLLCSGEHTAWDPQCFDLISRMIFNISFLTFGIISRLFDATSCKVKRKIQLNMLVTSI